MKAATLVLLSLLFSPTSIQASNLEVGFSAIDITPYPSAAHDNPNQPGYESAYGRIHLGGFGPYIPIFGKARWAKGVHDPVWARGVAVRNNGQTLVMISCDLPGLTWKYINPARREISKKFGIPTGNIIIASTHAHAGPDVAGYWSTFIKGHGSKYNQQVVKWLVESGSKAIQTLQPAEMKTLTTTHYSCINPKTKEMKKDPHCNIPKNLTDYHLPGGDQYDQMIVQTDKREPIVRNTMITIQHFVKPGTTQTLGTFINWHSHPDTMSSDNHFISSDFPHYLREYVEHEIGGTAVYFSGTVGCQIGPGVPIPLWSADRQPMYTGEITASGQKVRQFVQNDPWGELRSIGYEIGSEVVKAVRNTQGPYLRNAEVKVTTRQLDIAPNNFIHLLATGSVWRFDVKPEDQAYWYIGRCMGKYGCIRNDVELAQIGDMSLITGPGEIDPVYVYGREASVATWVTPKKTWVSKFKAYPGVLPLLKGPHVAVLGQAQNYLSYAFPLNDYVGSLKSKHPNHYEDMVTVNKHFGDDLGNLWQQMVGSDYRFSKRAILPKH